MIRLNLQVKYNVANFMANFRGNWRTWRTSGAIGAGWIQKGERIGQIQYKVNKSQKGKGSYSKQQGIAILD